MSEIILGSKMVQLIIALILVSTFFILGSTKLNSCVRAFGIQSFLLACVAVIVAYSTGKNDLYIVALLTFVIKAALIPYALLYIIRLIKVKKEVDLYVNISPSLTIGGVMVVISYYLTRSINSMSGLSSFAISTSIFLVTIGLFVMISRKKAIMQVLGILIMENGLFLWGISLTYGMPLLVELGIFFDVLIGALIMGILIFRINKTFESIDTDMLKTLVG